MIRQALRSGLQRIGLEVRRTRLVDERIADLVHFAQSSAVRTVIDVGANRGQFGRALRLAGWSGPIISFEPLRDAHADLHAAAAADGNWIAAPRMAIGASCGTMTINVASNSESSSLLPMLDRHVETAPHSAYKGTEQVPIATLDTAMKPFGDVGRILLKMDVQGYESQVLKGASDTCKRAVMLYSEMPLQPLYQGEQLFDELCGSILALGFRCCGMYNGHIDPATRERLQCDAVFLR